MKDLYQLSVKDSDAASEVLTKAFYNYPTFEYLFPNSAERKRDIGKVLKFLLKCGIFQGVVTAPSDKLEGVAIWYKSDFLDHSLHSLMKAGLFNLFFSINKISWFRLISLGKAKQINRNKILKGEYYFLDMIGVDPVYTNKGFAKLLIEMKLNLIDGEGLPCYLETSNMNNIKYYEKYGFYLLHQFSFGNYKSFCMIREPK